MIRHRFARPCALSLFLLLSISGLAQERPFHLILLADTQFGMHAKDAGFAQESANYEFAVATVNRLKPGAVVVLGDLVNRPGDAAQIAEYKRISARVDPSIPLYHVAGNHDVGNEPTPESLAAYRSHLGASRFGFRAGSVYGIVLDSTVIHRPEGVRREFEEQERWLESELTKAAASGATHIMVFQHHPYFLEDAGEKDEYGNIPLELRRRYLDLLRKHGVRYIFAGHNHKDARARDGDLEMGVCGPAGMPLNGGRSGMLLVTVLGGAVEHRYIDFGALPASLPEK